MNKTTAQSNYRTVLGDDMKDYTSCGEMETLFLRKSSEREKRDAAILRGADRKNRSALKLGLAALRYISPTRLSNFPVCWRAGAPICQNYAVAEPGQIFLAPPALQKCNRAVTFLSLSTCYFSCVRSLTRSRLMYLRAAYAANRKHGAMFKSVSLITELTK